MRLLLTLFMGLFATVAMAQKSGDTLRVKTSAICEMCKERIEYDMKFEKGVYKAELNLETKMLLVVYNGEKTTPERLKAGITKIGYSADELPANKKAFKRLPTCCKEEGHCAE